MTATPANFRAGFAALLGKPNAGKSTLLNALVGANIAAVSPLPQTTRERLCGIYTDEACQIVFVDLPGMIAATDKLNACLRENVLEEVRGVDVVIHLVDVADAEPIDAEIAAALDRVRVPIVLAVNKLDGKRLRTDAASWAGEHLAPEARARYRAMLGISARERRGLAELTAAVAPHLPPGPPLYDPEDLTDRDLRYLAQEAIRGKAYAYLHEELPYAVAVTVDEFVERDGGKWYIRATIHVERDSQKGMVIGAGGAMLKKISQAARTDIEALCDAPVFLELWVKVRENWRRSDGALREFGIRQSPKKNPRRGRGR